VSLAWFASKGNCIGYITKRSGIIELGCDEIQGFFFSKPVPADEFLRWKAGFRWERFGLQSGQRQLDFQESQSVPAAG